MNRVNLIAALALGSLLVSPMSSASAQQNQPEMDSALADLRQAEQHLRSASTDKGGHRVQAIQLVQQASREVQAGIDYDNAHYTAGEGGYSGGNQVRFTKGPFIEYLDEDSAVLAWSTNVQGSTRVEYGTSPRNLDQVAEAPWGADGRTHRVELRNLRADTTYFFEIETGQARGTGGEVESRGRLSFHTLPKGSPAIRNQPPR